MNTKLILGGVVGLVFTFGLAIYLLGQAADGQQADVEILNVSYDPTRELYQEINAHFIKHYQKENGVRVAIKQSHGGSGSQARAIIDGLQADVATLAMWTDSEAIRKKGLIKEGWEQRLPHNSLPYYSTIVFVVRKGNPKNIKDWPDIVQPGIQIITPNPKISGNGRLSFLAAWGSVLQRGGNEKEAEAFVTKLYRQTPVLDAGARGSTTTFAQKKIGDVHLTWENEAHLEIAEARGELEIVYPSSSIRAEPHVVLVDVNVDHKGTRKVAEAYLKFLYTDEAQEIIAKNHYRPSNEAVLKKFAASLPELRLFPITAVVSGGWEAAHERFFGSNGVFDRIYEGGK